MLDLWRRFHGEERVPEPGAYELFNVLHQCLGIIPNVEVLPFRLGRATLAAFDSFDAALVSIREQLYLASGGPEEAVIREHLETHLVQREGRLVWPGPSIAAAILWWSTEPDSWNRAH